MKKIFLCLLVFFIPYFVGATNITFNEIMYDAEGTDDGYEWVEIKNNFGNPKNLTGYKFCEGGDSVVCHSIKEEDNSDFILEAGALGIITDDREKFQSKYSFSGLILDSTGFSLLNSSGETLELKDDNGNVLDSLTYNPASGGEEGDTLSIFNNVWKNGEATPGSENFEKDAGNDNNNDEADNEDGDTDETDNTNHSYVEITDMFAGQKKLHAEIDEVGIVIAGAEFELVGRAYGLTGVEIKGINFLWNLGDGTKDREQKITHEYSFPGEHLVSLVVKSSGFTSPKTTQKITVIDPPIEISQVNFEQKFIEVKNDFNQILNIQDWILQMDGEQFVIPENTYILENGIIKFTSKNTSLRFKEGYRVFLLYPNGEKFQEYNPTLLEIIQDQPNLKELQNFEQPQLPTSSFKTLDTKEEDLNIVPNPTEVDLKEVSNLMIAQTASILPLKNDKNSFVRNNLIEILFFSLLMFLIIGLFYFHKKILGDSTKKEAKEFEIIEREE